MKGGGLTAITLALVASALSAYAIGAFAAPAFNDDSGAPTLAQAIAAARGTPLRDAWADAGGPPLAYAMLILAAGLLAHALLPLRRKTRRRLLIAILLSHLIPLLRTVVVQEALLPPLEALFVPFAMLLRLESYHDGSLCVAAVGWLELGLIGMLFWECRGTRADAGRCAHCGYDVTGVSLVTNRCPECGGVCRPFCVGDSPHAVPSSGIRATKTRSCTSSSQLCTTSPSG